MFIVSEYRYAYESWHDNMYVNDENDVDRLTLLITVNHSDIWYKSEKYVDIAYERSRHMHVTLRYVIWMHVVCR